MEIKPDQVDSIEDVGTLDGKPLKMIKLIGGFYMCVGRTKGSIREEALGAGSHPAIVKYNIEKQYPNVQFLMMKSEFLSDGSIVEKHSHHLSESLLKSGHDIYSIQNGTQITFYITKHNANIKMVKGELEKEYIVIKDIDFPKEFTKGISGATVEKAISCNAEKIRLGKK
jgi:hypothetical protein